MFNATYNGITHIPCGKNIFLKKSICTKLKANPNFDVAEKRKFFLLLHRDFSLSFECYYIMHCKESVKHIIEINQILGWKVSLKTHKKTKSLKILCQAHYFYRAFYIQSNLKLAFVQT